MRKKIVFDADHYETDLSLLVKRGDETIPQVKLAIGPSIGDQGVPHHTFYSVAPEAVSYVNGKLERHPPAGINGNSSSPDKLVLNGPVDWAGVADTYFGMVAVPDKPTEGLEYRTVAYEHKPNGGSPEKRFLTTALMPVPSDGSRIVIYAGPKDHDLLTASSKDIGALVQRQQPIDLEGMIDYGFLGWLSRPSGCSDPSCDHFSIQTNQQLWCRDHSLHDRHLLAFLSAEVALFKSDEESAEARAEDERVAGEDEGDEAK